MACLGVFFAPADSTTMSGPMPSVNSSSFAPAIVLSAELTTSSAPSDLASSRLCSRKSIAITLAPAALKAWSVNKPTVPQPTIATLSPGLTPERLTP